MVVVPRPLESPVKSVGVVVVPPAPVTVRSLTGCSVFKERKSRGEPSSQHRPECRHRSRHNGDVAFHCGRRPGDGVGWVGAGLVGAGEEVKADARDNRDTVVVSS